MTRTFIIFVQSNNCSIYVSTAGHFYFNMRIIISFYILQQLLYLGTRVESLRGQKIIATRHGEFPFIATFQYHPEEQNYCTGALITSKHVLTAAHCVDYEQPAGIKILFEVVESPDIAVAYSVRTWLTYNNWADRLNISRGSVPHDIAIVLLEKRIYDINPVQLSPLNKLQLQGREVVIIGRRRNRMQKAIVNVLRDEDCERQIRLVTGENGEITSEVLCTAAKPHILLQSGDSGAPLLDGNSRLLGVNFGECPDPRLQWGRCSKRFLKDYQVNLHYGIDYYRYYIASVTGDLH